MSKIGGYIIWCEEEGYTNDQGEVTSMEYADKYMKTMEYFKEHIAQGNKIARENSRVSDNRDE
jgi:arginine utilization protein RocB